MRDASVRRWSTVHKWFYRLTRGIVGRRLVSNDMLLLTTTGHASGRRHTVPLLYLEDGDRLLVIASYGGRERHPTWYDNLTKEPSALVQVKGTRMKMRARTADDEERSRLWPSVEAAYSGYVNYQARTTRQIPIVVLEAIVPD